MLDTATCYVIVVGVCVMATATHVTKSQEKAVSAVTTPRASVTRRTPRNSAGKCRFV